MTLAEAGTEPSLAQVRSAPFLPLSTQLTLPFHFRILALPRASGVDRNMPAHAGLHDGGVVATSGRYIQRRGRRLLIADCRSGLRGTARDTGDMLCVVYGTRWVPYSADQLVHFLDAAYCKIEYAH